MDLRVLFVSYTSILDSTNGGAVSMRTLLAGLQHRGVECRVISGAAELRIPIGPTRTVAQRLADLARYPGVQLGKDLRGAEAVTLRDGGLAHTILTLPPPSLKQKASWEKALLGLVESGLRRHRPHVVLCWGLGRIDHAVIDLSHQAGAPVLAAVLAEETNPATLRAYRRADMVLAPSRFLARQLARKLRVRCEPLYPMVDVDRCRARRRHPRFITFVNPEPDKGALLFLRIVEQALAALPDARFLVVGGRWSAAVFERLGIRLHEFANLTVLPNQRDVRKVYAVTRILLFPSLCEEAFGLCVAEAQANGIPVLATRRGGIPEALNGGGFLFQAPRRCLANRVALPSASEVRPWLRCLAKLLGNPAVEARAQQRARAAAAAFSPDATANEAVRLLERLRLRGVRGHHADS